jgi:hypothetical protein
VIVTSDGDLHDHRDTIPVAVEDPRTFLDTLQGTSRAPIHPTAGNTSSANILLRGF